MFDTIFDNIFFLIPVAIIIGRIVMQARKKKQPPPPAPRIPVHFEDEKPNRAKPVPGTRRTVLRTSGGGTAKAPAKKGFLDELLSSLETAYRDSKEKTQEAPEAAYTESFNAAVPAEAPVAYNEITEPAAERALKGSTAAANGFSFKLNHLSPLKQAVIMAEILGPPKGMA